jgi:hypothetical protein
MLDRFVAPSRGHADAWLSRRRSRCCASRSRRASRRRAASSGARGRGTSLAARASAPPYPAPRPGGPPGRRRGREDPPHARIPPRRPARSVSPCGNPSRAASDAVPSPSHLHPWGDGGVGRLGAHKTNCSGLRVRWILPLVTTRTLSRCVKLPVVRSSACSLAFASQGRKPLSPLPPPSK